MDHNMQLEGHSSKMMLYVLRSVLKNNFSVYIAGLFFLEELPVISNWNQSKKTLGGGGKKRRALGRKEVG